MLVFNNKHLFLLPVRLILVLYRLFFFALYTGRIVAEVYWKKVVLRRDFPQVMLVRRRWAKNLLKGIGVGISVEGIPPQFPCLLLANHRSYMDPILMLCDVDAFPVAKAELASWPLIGKGAKWAGILYVQRNQSGSRVSTLRAIDEVINKKGHSVILFPEGTTSDLPGMLPLKKGAFRTAARGLLPLVPVAIHYPDSRDFWVGNVSFLQHAWRRFQDKKIDVQVHYGPKIEGADSAELEHQVRQWIEGKLQECRRNDQRKL